MTPSGSVNKTLISRQGQVITINTSDSHPLLKHHQFHHRLGSTYSNTSVYPHWRLHTLHSHSPLALLRSTCTCPGRPTLQRGHWTSRQQERQDQAGTRTNVRRCTSLGAQCTSLACPQHRLAVGSILGKEAVLHGIALALLLASDCSLV
jgi:hypothetical protein